MSGLLNFFLHFIFIVTFVFLIIVSVVILRPLRIHRTRKISTMALKMSYILYLVLFIVLIYLILFFSEIPMEEDLWDEDWVMKLCYGVIVVSFFIPNLAIMARRKFKKFRQQFNIFFTGVNILISILLLLVMRYYPFSF